MLKELKPFQIKGAEFLANNIHALLADEPGLGKTLQAIAAAELLELKRILVVCPASVRLGWAQELQECLGHKEGWDIISYNGAAKHISLRYDAIILDEAHFLKTPESQRTQAVFGPAGLARRAQYKWMLTGTPVLNRPVELWPMLKTLHPAFAKVSFTHYANKYCSAFWDGYGVNTKGASNLVELSGLLGSFMLRRTKAEVLPELPPKVISRVPLAVSRQALAAVFDEEDRIGRRESKISPVAEDFSQLGDMATLLRLTGEAKVSATVAFIRDLLETVEKVVVFVKHRSVIHALEQQLGDGGYGPIVYQGGMSDGQKRTAIEKFQGEDARVFVGQIQAAGTGINGLQGVCNTVVFGEMSWVPGEVGQACDRLHRMGQVCDSVNIYLLHVPGTLESAVLGAFDAKSKVIDRLMNTTIKENVL